MADRVSRHERKELVPEVDHTTGLWGDVNLDLEVNIADINAVIDVILDGSGGAIFDVNYDGEIQVLAVIPLLYRR